jgi:flagellar basal-body rod protein FlgG
VSGAFEIGKVALRTQQGALEVMANNVANASTPGFKRAAVVYSAVVTSPEIAVSETEALAGQSTPILGGVRMDVRDDILAQGGLKTTGETLDFAIDGAGMIELLGPEGQSYLWRGGRLSVNRDGHLAGPSDFPLRALITIPDDATAITIDRAGVVSASVSDGEPIELGQITLVRVDSDASLQRADDGLFKIRENVRVMDSVPGEDGSGTIVQGAIEESNVDFSQAMIELLMIQRAYAASAQIVQSADQLAAVTNNLKR